MYNWKQGALTPPARTQDAPSCPKPALSCTNASLGEDAAARDHCRGEGTPLTHTSHPHRCGGQHFGSRQAPARENGAFPARLPDYSSQRQPRRAGCAGSAAVSGLLPAALTRAGREAPLVVPSSPSAGCGGLFSPEHEARSG